MPGCFASEGKASRQGVQRAGSAEHCVKSFGKISPLAGGRSPRRDCYILYGDSDISAVSARHNDVGHLAAMSESPFSFSVCRSTTERSNEQQWQA